VTGPEAVIAFAELDAWSVSHSGSGDDSPDPDRIGGSGAVGVGTRAASSLAASKPAPSLPVSSLLIVEQDVVYELIDANAPNSAPIPLARALVNINVEKCRGCLHWIDLAIALLPSGVPLSYGGVLSRLGGACSHPTTRNHSSSYTVRPEAFQLGPHYERPLNGRDYSSVCVLLLEMYGDIIADTIWHHWDRFDRFEQTNEFADRICRMFSTC